MTQPINVEALVQRLLTDDGPWYNAIRQDAAKALRVLQARIDDLQVQVDELLAERLL